MTQPLKKSLSPDGFRGEIERDSKDGKDGKAWMVGFWFQQNVMHIGLQAFKSEFPLAAVTSQAQPPAFNKPILRS